MPWEHCGRSLLDDEDCSCGLTKAQWTIKVDQTRVFRVGRRPDTWVELELVDAQGRPVSGEPYELRLPNGRRLQGTLDAQGLAAHPKVPDGRGLVRFPARADDALTGPAGSARTDAGFEVAFGERHRFTLVTRCLHLALVDAAGGPAAAHRYLVEVPALPASFGWRVAAEGRLDAQGEAQVDVALLGGCDEPRVTFPDEPALDEPGDPLPANTWLWVELLDPATGEPVAEHPYRVERPDGAGWELVAEGLLDETGRAFVTGLPPGLPPDACRVTFPASLDDEEERDDDLLPASWLWVELRDPATGEPVAEHPYRVERPDGDEWELVAEGLLDETGRAFVTGLPPGLAPDACRVTFPSTLDDEEERDDDLLPTTWLWVELRDPATGEPVAEHPYRVERPDGDDWELVAEGLLDEAGRAFVTGLPPGLASDACRVTFPATLEDDDEDDEDDEPIARSGLWIQHPPIDGQPAAERRFRVRGPDALLVASGRLDESGRCYLPGLTPWVDPRLLTVEFLDADAPDHDEDLDDDDPEESA